MPTNTAEGGTNGTTVTAANSGGLSGTAFDLVTISDATATLIFDNTHPAHGALAYKFQLGAVTAEDYLQRLASFSATDVDRATFRFNCYWTANPAAAIYLLRVANAAGSASFGGVKLDTAGKLLAVDGAGSTVATMASAIPLNTLFHVDVEMVVTSGTAGRITIWRTDVLDSGRVVDQITATITAAVGFSRIRWGHTGTGVANVGPWWMDDLEEILPDGVVPNAATFLPDSLFPDDGAQAPLGPMYLPWPEGAAVSAAQASTGSSLGEQRTDGITTGAKASAGAAQSGQRVTGLSTGVKGATGATQGPARTAGQVAARKQALGSTVGNQRTSGLAVRGAPAATGAAVGQQRAIGQTTGVKGAIAAESGQQRTVGQVAARKQALGVPLGSQRTTGITAGAKQALGVATGQQRTAGLAGTTPPPPSGAATGQQRVSGLTTGRKNATVTAASGQQHSSGTTTGIHRGSGATSGQQHSSGITVIAKRATGATVGQQRTSGTVVVLPPLVWASGTVALTSANGTVTLSGANGSAYHELIDPTPATVGAASGTVTHQPASTGEAGVT